MSLSNSLPSPACEESDSSAGLDHSFIPSFLTTQPQHIIYSGVDTTSTSSSQFQSSQLQKALASASESGMSVRKRCAESLDTDQKIEISDYAVAAITATVASEDTSLPTPPSIKTSLSNKKQRVSFCQTTKAPSLSKTLCPPSNIQKITLPSNTIMKHSVSCTALPQLGASSAADLLVSEAPTGELDLSVSPANFVKMIVLQSKSITGAINGEDIISDASLRVKRESYFLPFTEAHLEAYTTEMVNAVQGNDVETLRSYQKAGHVMQASNRFGESMLHTSCRRGFTDVVKFFLDEAMVSPRVKDDMGRTPMHDVCWSSAAPNHVVMKKLILAAPELLLSKDKRGHSPFDYARREYWPNWVTFLNENRQFIVNSLVSSFLENSDALKAEESEDGWMTV